MLTATSVNPKVYRNAPKQSFNYGDFLGGMADTFLNVVSNPVGHTLQKLPLSGIAGLTQAKYLTADYGKIQKHISTRQKPTLVQR